MAGDCTECRFHIRTLYLSQAITVAALCLCCTYVYLNNNGVGPSNSNDHSEFTETLRQRRDSSAAARTGRTDTPRRDHRSNENAGETSIEYDEFLKPSQSQDWLMLPSYTRLDSIKKLCVSINDICGRQQLTVSTGPAGPSGPPGPPGPTGPAGPPGKDAVCWTGCGDTRPRSETVSIVTLDNNNTVAAAAVISLNDTDNNTNGATKSSTTALMLLGSTAGAVYQYSTHSPGLPPPTTESRKKKKTNRARKHSGRLPLKRKKKCFIQGFGAPKSHGELVNKFGAWMHDPVAGEEHTSWVAEHITGNLLHEYRGFRIDRRSPPVDSVELESMFDGTNHVVYNGSIYYQEAGKNRLLRVALADGKIKASVELPHALHKGTVYLYERMGDVEGNSYIDVASDEHGVWAIYRRKSRGYLMVSKVDAATLEIQATWKVPPLKTRHIGQTFVACGVLYAVDSAAKQPARITRAFDLYTGRFATVNLTWHNQFGLTTMLNYDFRDAKLYSYDSGRLVATDVFMVQPQTVNSTERSTFVL